MRKSISRSLEALLDLAGRGLLLQNLVDEARRRLLSDIVGNGMGGEMAEVKITVRRNGPYRVEAPEGGLRLVDADGNEYDLAGKPAFSLCRCGGSVSKPFCDGTHSRIGFQAAEAAVRATDTQQAAPVQLDPPAGSPAKG